MKLFYRIVAVLGGVVAGGLCVGLIEWCNSLMYPMPEGLTMDDREGMRQWVSTLPTSAFVVLPLAWGAGCLVAAWIARRIAPGRGAWPAVIASGVLTTATIFNLANLPHPSWLWPIGIGACLTGGVVGMILAGAKSYNIHTTRAIRAPLEKVFQMLARIENFSQAVPGITNIEFLTDQKYGVGTRFRETRIMNGKEASTELEVSELVENERIRLVSDAGGTFWDTVFAVKPQGDHVEMNMHMDARPHNALARLVTPLILGMVSKAVESDMDAVQRACEESADK
jgi:carbon monoxide dehydrogenase subunit G